MPQSPRRDPSILAADKHDERGLGRGGKRALQLKYDLTFTEAHDATSMALLAYRSQHLRGDLHPGEPLPCESHLTIHVLHACSLP